MLTASPSHAHDLARAYQQSPRKFTWVPNGFDPEDFETAAGQTPPSRDEKFTLLYTGTLFPVTSLRLLWEGLSLLWEDERVKFRVVVAGKSAGGEVTDPKLPGLEVMNPGHLDHAQAIREMLHAQALVLTLQDLPGSRQVIPSKLYEYLAARRPILSLTPPGEASAIVEACGAGAVVAPGDAQGVARVLRDWLNKPPARPNAPPDIFSRPEQAAQLARVLDRTV